MSDGRSSRTELICMYDELIDLWGRAHRLQQAFLVYLIELALLELRDRVGADLPMPSMREQKRHGCG